MVATLDPCDQLFSKVGAILPQKREIDFSHFLKNIGIKLLPTTFYMFLLYYECNVKLKVLLSVIIFYTFFVSAMFYLSYESI